MHVCETKTKVTNFLDCIGKWFGDAGLQDIVTEAEFCAKSSVKGVISGHHYKPSV